jgi:hypothetical protein
MEESSASLPPPSGAAVRTYEEECAYLHAAPPPASSVEHCIRKGFVPGMRVGGTFFLSADLLALQMSELRQYADAAASGGYGGFLPVSARLRPHARRGTALSPALYCLRTPARSRRP